MELLITVKPEAGGEPRNVRLDFSHRLVLGRGPESPIPLDGGALSREHFAFVLENGALHVRDLSSNGTWLNGRRLSREQPWRVRAGDTVRISGYEFDIDFAEGAEHEPVAAGEATANSTAELPPDPPNPVANAMAPVARFWNGFTGLEKFLIAAAAICAGLVAAYLQVS